jgi:hypothetical protein
MTLSSVLSLILPAIRLLPLLSLMTYLVVVVMVIVMFAWRADNGVAVCVITIRIVVQADYFN